MPKPGTWLRSSYCGNTTCVEVLRTDGVVLVRNSADNQKPVVFSAEEWDAFLRGVQAGEFGGTDA